MVVPSASIVIVFDGPLFTLAEETTPEALAHQHRDFNQPLLVKGALRAWPAWERWSFDKLAEWRLPNGKEVVRRFQDGLVEQGKTQPLPVLPVGPYLRELSTASRIGVSEDAGLLPMSRRKTLQPNARFHLNWSHMQTFETNRRYLADWNILDDFPERREDFHMRTLWQGHRWMWEYVFIGPANTVTGLHQDIHDNWFCQVRGTKEVLLFPPSQTPHMCVSEKYNLGSVLSRINISKLDQPSAEASEFAKTEGIYARVEAGDALFIPQNNWHAVIALEPSISLGVFGLTAREVLTVGAWSEFKNVLHTLKLYHRGDCICHESRV